MDVTLVVAPWLLTVVVVVGRLPARPFGRALH